jgi:hypothetical protein
MAINTLKRTILLLPLATIIGCHSTGHQDVCDYADSEGVSVAYADSDSLNHHMLRKLGQGVLMASSFHGRMELQ